MRTSALAALLGLVILNGFLSYSGRALARETRRTAAHDGVKLPLVSEAALVLQPGFYVVAVAAFAATALGFRRRLSEKALIYSVVGLLFLDVFGLFVSLWGVGLAHFLM